MNDHLLLIQLFTVTLYHGLFLIQNVYCKKVPETLAKTV